MGGVNLLLKNDIFYKYLYIFAVETESFGIFVRNCIFVCSFYCVVNDLYIGI